MRFLLDTNVWIYLLKGNQAIQTRMQRTPAGEIVACSIVWAELLHGARKYGRRDERVMLVERTLLPFTSLPFDDAAARRYAEVRDVLESRGQIIGPNDLMIAAIALAHDLTLVTANLEFDRIDGLRTENWLVGH